MSHLVPFSPFPLCGCLHRCCLLVGFVCRPPRHVCACLCVSCGVCVFSLLHRYFCVVGGRSVPRREGLHLYPSPARRGQIQRPGERESVAGESETTTPAAFPFPYCTSTVFSGGVLCVCGLPPALLGAKCVLVHTNPEVHQSQYDNTEPPWPSSRARRSMGGRIISQHVHVFPE